MIDFIPEGTQPTTNYNLISIESETDNSRK